MGKKPGSFHYHLRLLKHYLSGQSWTVAGMAIFLIVDILLQVFAPQIARSFIDKALAGSGGQILIATALWFIGISLFQPFTKILATYLSEQVAWRSTNAMRVDLASHLMQLDLDFHIQHSPGELIERVDGDINTLARFFSSFVVQLFGSVLLLAGVLISFFTIDAWLAISFTVFSLISLLFLGWLRKFGTSFWQADRESSAVYFGYLGEVLTATEDIRSNGAVRYALSRLSDLMRQWIPVGLKADLWGNTLWMSAVMIFAVGDAMAFWMGGHLFKAHEITIGTVYLIIAYTVMLAAPLETIRSELQDFQKADAAIIRIEKLFGTRSRLRDGDASLPSGALAAEFRSVHFCYRLFGDDTTPPEVLRNVNFQLEKGSVLGIAGRTGSGKTTIARLLFRQFDPVQGKVLLDGVDLRQAKLKSVRSMVGFVTQDVRIFEATLRDNLTFFEEGISDRYLLQVLETLGLKPWVNHLPQGLETVISASSLSAGEAQLLSLARVFMKDPGLIILDEASSRLDPATEVLLERALDQLLKGRTTILIAHRLATLNRADNILVLEQGKVVEQGLRSHLAADENSRYSKLLKMSAGEVLS
ncbi:MAG TPA: ABC transporter ATP-binding protein [Bacillales bacterium]|nr:ABC transporter ATP-binding protein [Bacillales bacterium]